MIYLRLALIGVFALICACASRTALTDKREIRQEILTLSEKQEQSLTSYAALLRVKLSRAGKIDDFRVELFSRGDSLLSVYVRGFLGKSVLKTVLTGDSLTIYFPSDGFSYVGLRSDLEVGELESAGHIIDFLLTLFSGSLASPDTLDWEFYAHEKGSRFELNLTDKVFDNSLQTKLATDKEEFPFLKFESFYLNSRDGSLKLHLETISGDFNREIPDSKFKLEIPPDIQPAGKEELARLLTEIS